MSSKKREDGYLLHEQALNVIIEGLAQCTEPQDMFPFETCEYDSMRVDFSYFDISIQNGIAR